MEEVCKKLRIVKIYMSPYHPQNNGILGGRHRMLHDSIRKMIQCNKVTWDELIPKYIKGI